MNLNRGARETLLGATHVQAFSDSEGSERESKHSEQKQRKYKHLEMSEALGATLLGNTDAAVTSLDIEVGLVEFTPQKWDFSKDDINACQFVIVYPWTEKDRAKSTENGSDLLRKLKRGVVPIESKVVLSGDEDEVFVCLMVSDDNILAAAEHFEVELPLHSNHEHTSVGVMAREVFTMSCKDRFAELNSLTKIKILQTILEGEVEEGGLGMDLHNMVQKKEFGSYFAVHNEEERLALKKKWIRLQFFDAPLDEIASYYGEAIAMYFAFLQRYTVWLGFASVVGILLFIIGLILGATSDINEPAWNASSYGDANVPCDYLVTEKSSKSAQVVGAFFAIFIALWSTLFSEFWKRRQAQMAYKWDVMDFEETERARPEFLVVPNLARKPGFYAPGDYFVDLSDWPEERLREYNVEEEPVFTTEQQRTRTGQGLPIITILLGVVVVGTVGILFFKKSKAIADSSTYTSPVGSVMNAVFIIIMNGVYSRVAEYLTNRENHRTDTGYDDSLIVKTFCFQFVNSYVSLFWISYIQGTNAQIFGAYQTCEKCNCWDALGEQLAIVFLIQIFWGQFQEVGIPYIIGVLKARSEQKKVAKAGHGSEMEPPGQQAKKGAYAGVFSDYLEMLIQYGYVTLFVASFPLTPAFAFLNNLVEAKTDALKLLSATRRPEYKGAEDIGSWQLVLDVMSIAATVNNLALLIFVARNLLSESDGYSYSLKIIVLVGVEHLVFLLKLVIAALIPDVPSEVVRGQALKTYIKEFPQRRELAQKRADKVNSENSRPKAN